MWIDTHCHLDAPEFDPDRDDVVVRARRAGVGMMVLPAVQAADFTTVRALAHRVDGAYALGIHPLRVPGATEADLKALDEALQSHRDDPRLAAVGEIGLDHFVPDVDRDRQAAFFHAQLRLARAHGLPVILHVRRSADALLHGLRRIPVSGGIAHAFNGSLQQAQAFVELGFRLGFGGTVTHERALQIRRLAAAVADNVPVLETDAPDIPPQWLYRTAEQRAQGLAQGRNEPAELPRIGSVLAVLRGWTVAQTQARTQANALAALPRLADLVKGRDLAPGGLPQGSLRVDAGDAAGAAGAADRSSAAARLDDMA